MIILGLDVILLVSVTLTAGPLKEVAYTCYYL